MPGRTPGRYETLRPLGLGPYGDVRLARDSFGGMRLVAVKVLDQKSLSPRAFTRLQREFMLRRGLRHPHLALLLDLDFDDAGNCRIVSEYVDGPDFIAAAAKLGQDAVPELAVELLQALGHLHDCGLVHGAIKPTNVLVSGDHGSPWVKLLDFDLRPDHEISPASAAATLRYAAPEVLRGQAADLSSDLYGVGMLLREAIDGRLPFDDPASGPGIVAWHLSRTVVRAPRDHMLSAIVERLLDPDPDRRFASTHEVIRAISVACGRRFRTRTLAGGEQLLITGRFVGREREMARLGAACRRILNGGGAQVFLLVGPPGTGKSRALDECRVLAQISGIRVVRAVCRRERSAPLGVLRDLLHQLLVLLGTDHPVAEAHRAVLTCVVPDSFEGSAAASPFLAAEHDWTRIKNGIAEFLAAAAQLRPLVLTIDEIQSIDETSLNVLLWVFQHFSACPLMLLGALEEFERDDLRSRSSRLIENEAHEVLRMNPLGVTDVEQILSGVLAVPGNVRELTGLVLRLTGGVPLYVEELVRSLVEGQMIDMLVDGGLATVDDSPAEARERALGLVSGRVNRLPEDAQHVLEALVLFDGAARAEDLGAAALLRAGEVEGAIRRLETSDLVRVEATRLGTVVAMRGSLFREAISRRVSTERLAVLHDAVVDRLEAAPVASPDQLADLAFHATRGTRPAKALLFCRAAAREAMSLHACDRARDLLEQARRIASLLGDAAATRNVLDLLSEALERLGEPDHALLALAEITASAGVSKEEIVKARLRIAAIHIHQRRPAAAELALEAASIEAAELGDLLNMSRAERLRARLLVRNGSPGRALVLLERARGLLGGGAAPGDLAHAIAEIGEAHGLLEEHARAKECHRESLARFLELRDRSGVGLAHLNLGLAEWGEGRHAAAIARLGRCERIARRLGHYALLARALHHQGVIEGDLGRLADAVRTLTRSVHLMRRLDDEPGICEGLAQLGWTHHLAGRHEMARMLIEDVVTRRGRLNDLSGVASARVMLGRLLCVIGSLDDAETLLRTAADAAEQLGLEGVATIALQGLAEVALRRDCPGETLSLLDRLTRVANGRLDRRTAMGCDLLRAEIDVADRGADARAGLGRVLRAAHQSRNALAMVSARRLAGHVRVGGAALASLRAARRVADRCGFREVGWRARSDLGSLLLAEGKVDQAVDMMKEAMTLLRALHDELPARRRETYVADPRKEELRQAFAFAVERIGVPVA